jgi:hypothetical protein
VHRIGRAASVIFRARQMTPELWGKMNAKPNVNAFVVQLA